MRWVWVKIQIWWDKFKAWLEEAGDEEDAPSQPHFY